jgi:glutamate synthase domain-containing protein 1
MSTQKEQHSKQSKNVADNCGVGFVVAKRGRKEGMGETTTSGFICKKEMRPQSDEHVIL